MSDAKKYIVMIVLALLLLVGVGAGSIGIYANYAAKTHAIELEKAKSMVAEATKAADVHLQRADDLATQRDAVEKVAVDANLRAANSNKKLQEALNQPKPVDLSEELDQTKGQLAAAEVALVDEQTAHKQDNAGKELLVIENKELRLSNDDLRMGLKNQIQLTVDMEMRYEKAERGRIRWRNVTVSVSLVGIGAGAAAWLSHK